jgi:hypothetical protein
MKRHFLNQLFRLFLLTVLEGFSVTMLLGQYASLIPDLRSAKTYRIGTQSRLTLEGTTNVNHFSCDCLESFPAQVFYVDKLDDENCSIVFRETALNLKVRSLDCGNKMMNKDMYDALNAHMFPNIQIELLRVSEERCDLLGEEMNWVKFIAHSRITLNGEQKDYWINVIVRKTGHNQFRFIGDKVLSMKDFGIEPPTAALGMVKVYDEIKISLDMQVIVE